MNDTNGIGIIAADTFVQGKILNGRRIEVHGYVEGTISSDLVVVAKGGRAYGNIRAVNTQIFGDLQGDIRIKELINIADGGRVSGKVQYGSITLAPGGDLSADVRNVPPSMSGDGVISVHRGRSAVITREDLHAVDPDDAPEDLMFKVKRISNGMIALTSAPTQAVTEFTQAQVNARSVMFVHDGGRGDSTDFEVIVYDDEGANSGKPQKISVLVRG